jgi:nucleotide-binding universal stress UspA family protein
MNDHLMADEWTAPRRIVVGVDGSPNSVAALRRAVMQAAQRHAELELAYVVAPGAGPLALETGTQLLKDVVGRAFPGGPGVPARLVVESGEPAAVLVRLSASAELLVIGARAHSGEGNLLGGVTVPRCMDRALCPVDICADQAAHVS